MTAVSPLLRKALEHVPVTERMTAARLAVYLESGYGMTEAAHALNMTRSEAGPIASAIQVGLVEAFRESGFSDGEIARTIRVATTVLAQTQKPKPIGEIKWELKL